MAEDSYRHHVHAGEPGQPLFVVLHGTGGDENQFFGFAKQLMPKATVISPRGDVSEMGAARFFKRTGEGVYDFVDLERATIKLSSFLAEKRREYQAGQIIGLGYSNGANILANIMIEAPDLVNGAVLMHPLIPFVPKEVRVEAPRRVLITAGEQDSICPAPLTRKLADYFKQTGDQVEVEWHAGGHEIRPNEGEALKRFLAPYIT